MPYDLRTELLHVVPAATEWAQGLAALVQRDGAPLDAKGLAVARRVGVKRVEDVRVMLVDAMPYPESPTLQRAAMATGILGANTRGLTFGHSIFLRRDRDGTRVLSHELRHVHQYEEIGSIGAYLALYLAQIVAYGYVDAPLEIDARRHEHD